MDVIRLNKLTLFLRMRTKEIAKTQRKCTPTEELFLRYWKSGSPKRIARSDFLTGSSEIAVSAQCACAVKI